MKKTAMLSTYIICPECKGELQASDTSLTCQKCSVEYETSYGIPIFLKNKNFYYCPTKKEWLSQKLDEYYQKVNSDPSEWESLLIEILEKIPNNNQKREWIDNLVDESRAVYKYLTSLNPDAHVLNFGSGWDNTTINLARTAKKVTAIDLTKERIQILALKKKYYGIENIDLFCGGDRPYLPFKDNTFDTIYINGVLEWVASDWSQIEKKYQHQNKLLKFFSFLSEVYGSHDPREIQKRFLKEMRRVLKDDGEMYIGIENRYSRLYFGQRPDHHSFIWFGSLYPRLVAHVVSILKSHHPYLTFTYSEKRMAKLVREVGFKHKKCYGLEPMYRTPNNIFNLDKKDEIEVQRLSNDLFAQYLPNWLYKKTIASYGYIGSGSNSSKPWVEAVVDDFLHKKNLHANEFQIKTIKSNQKEKLTIFVEEIKKKEIFYVIKVPITKKVEEPLINNFKYLQMLQDKIKDRKTFVYLSKILPKPILASEYNGQKYFVETGCVGVTLKGNHSIDSDALKELPLIFKEFNQIHFEQTKNSILLNEYKDKFNYLKLFLQTDLQKNVYEKITSNILHSLSKVDKQLYLRKSDFSMSNILVDGLRVSGIIDFDETSLSPCKSKNFSEFLLSYSRYRNNIFWSDAIIAILDKKLDNFSSKLNIEKTLELLDTDLDELGVSMQLSWLNHVFYMTQFESGRHSKQRLVPLFHEVLEKLSDKF